MQFLKEHGYGGVIIWSLDLDDKTGEVCNEGPFPIFNAAKRELLILPERLLPTINTDNSSCTEENRTITAKQLQSKTIRQQQSILRKSTENVILVFFSILDFFVLLYSIFLRKFL